MSPTAKRERMTPEVQAFATGFPITLLHAGVTLLMLALGAGIYALLTPYKEIQLIREGNAAAAISYGGVIVGLAAPLAVSLSASPSVLEVVVWGLATTAVQLLIFRLTDFRPEDAAHVPTGDLDLGGGRSLQVPKSLKGVAVFSFKRLCGENRGAADYIAIARAYHTVFVVGIPVMGPDNRNEAIRFTKLVDTLYEHNVKLFATAAAEPSDLYTSGDGSFEFARTVSRLEEMRSAGYMAHGHGVEG